MPALTPPVAKQGRLTSAINSMHDSYAAVQAVELIVELGRAVHSPLAQWWLQGSTWRSSDGSSPWHRTFGCLSGIGYRISHSITIKIGSSAAAST